MTMRERMLAVVRGHAHDRVPFVQYSGLAAPDREVWALLGRENFGLLRWGRVHRIEHPGCAFESENILRDGLRGKRTVLHTPEGDLVEERFEEPAYRSAHIQRHFIQTPQDYRALRAYLRCARVVEDIEPYLRDLRELGDDGLSFVSIGRTPFQQLWIEWAGIENLCRHLADAPAQVEETLEAMRALQRRVCRVVRGALERVPAPYVNFGDNITAPVIGERFFRRYCLTEYDYMAGLLEGTGVPVCVHMDGDLKPLWSAIGESRIGCLDSLSPPPDNDTSAGEAAAMWPDMRLFVNFPSSVHLGGADAVYRRARHILEEAGRTGRLWIQISENVPPGRWRETFPAIARAIEDFGAPG